MFTRIITLLLTTLFLLLTPINAHAQTSLPASPAGGPTTISPTSPLYTDLLVHNIFHTFSCLAVGQSVIGHPCLTYQLTKNAQGAIQGVPVLSSVNLSGGALGGVNSMIGALYENPPVRTSEYLASVGQGLGLIKEARAQGVVGSGASVLSPILSLWQVSRNIAYLIMIIIFVVIGIMIIFRQRINPQTVITAQAALPGLVIGLILITFSYFLAGLISDTAFVGTNVVGYYFASAQGKANDATKINLAEEISSHSVLSIFSPFIGIVTWGDAINAVSAIYDKLGSAKGNISLLVGFLTAQFISPMTGALGALPPPYGLFVGPALNLLAVGVGAALPSQILGITLSFIATFALIYQMLQLLLALLRSYLTIVFLTISAPFQFLFSSLPGRQGIATGWIMNLLANVLVFPAVIAVFYFVAFLLGPANPSQVFKISYSDKANTDILTSTAYAQNSQLNIIHGTTFPLLGGLDLSFIRILLAFGALIALPAIPEIVVKSVGKVGQAGQIIGQEISGGIRSGQGYAAQERGAFSGQVGILKQKAVGDKTYTRTAGGWVETYATPSIIGYMKGDRIMPPTATTGRTNLPKPKT